MSGTKKITGGFLVAAVVVGCDVIQLEEYVPQEYAWSGSVAKPFAAAVASDDSAAADSVTYMLYTVLEESGSAEGILTILGDTALAYDPYEVLVEGFMTRDSAGTAAAMLAEYTTYDGTRCRMYGVVDSLGWWNSEVGCGGVYMDSVVLHPTTTGLVSGVVKRAGDAAEGVRVQYCAIGEDLQLGVCHVGAYSGAGGVFRLEAPPGEWFVIFSLWDPIWDEWEYCRSALGSDSYLGRRVDVRLAQVADASIDCPWFT